MRGTAQNPDTFFQARETVNPFYAAVPGDRAGGDGPVRRDDRPRSTSLFDYDGAADAERVIVLMGSGAETARETAAVLRAARRARRRAAGAAVPPVLRRRISWLPCPAAVRAIAVLEQTKEPGAAGEPLYLDVVATLAQAVAQRRARKPCRA